MTTSEPMGTPPADAVAHGWADPITDPHRRAVEICRELGRLLRSMELPESIGGPAGSLFDILDRQVGSLETHIRLHYSLEQRTDAVDHAHGTTEQGYVHRHPGGSKPHEHDD